MNKQRQNKHIREESIPVQPVGLVAIEPSEDLYHVMEGCLIIIPDADTGFAFAALQVHGWGMVHWLGSPHRVLHFDAEVWADRPHRHIAATHERHAASKGANR